MTREELIRELAEEEGIPEEAVDAVIDQLFDLITNRMADQEETSIYGFGKFGIRWWKGRSGRDPQTGEEIEIEGRWMPYWTPSNTLIEEGEPHPKEIAGVPDDVTDAEDFDEKDEPEGTELSDDSEEELDELEPILEEESEEEDQEEEPVVEPVADLEPPETREYWDYSARERSTSRKWLLPLAAIVALIVIIIIGAGFFSGESTDISEPASPEFTAESSEQSPESSPAAEDTEQQTSAMNETNPPAAEQMEVESSPGSETTAIMAGSTAGREQFFDDYQTALDQFRDHNYTAAKQMLEQLLQSKPPLDYADNVQYWLGEAEFALQQYEQSIHSFGRVFSYPNTNKMEDAILMMAYAYRQLGDYDQARLLLIKFRHQYSDSRFASVAERWLRDDSLQQVTTN